MKRNAANSVKGVRSALNTNRRYSHLATSACTAFPKVTSVNIHLQELSHGALGCYGITFLFLYARKRSEECAGDAGNNSRYWKSNQGILERQYSPTYWTDMLDNECLIKMVNCFYFILKMDHIHFKCYIIPNKKKVKLSRYMPWRHMGGQEVQLLLIHNLGTNGGEWSASRPGRALSPVPIGQEAGWAQRTQRQKEKSSASVENRTPVIQSVVSHYTD
jgi:hypothetical protein